MLRCRRDARRAAVSEAARRGHQCRDEGGVLVGERVARQAGPEAAAVRGRCVRGVAAIEQPNAAVTYRIDGGTEGS